MHITQQTTQTSEELRPFYDELTASLARQEIEPDLVTPLGFYPGMPQPPTSLLVARDQGDIVGVLKFQRIKPSSHRKLEYQFKNPGKYFGTNLTDENGRSIPLELKKRPGFADLTFQENLMFIRLLESYYPGRFIGSTLIQTLQEEQTEGIFLEPDDNPRVSNFYRQNGFKETGLYANHPQKPIMIWTP